MDNEATRLVNNGNLSNSNPQNITPPPYNPNKVYGSAPVNNSPAPSKPTKKGNNVAATVGVGVAGAAVGVGATAYANNLHEEDITKENVTNDPSTESQKSRNEGHAHNTDSSNEEAHPIDHNENHIEPDASIENISIDPLDATLSENSIMEDVSANPELVSLEVEPVDNEVHVLGVEAVQSEDGQIMNVALVESEGDHAILVDVDNNGVMEVLLHDDNADGYIQESEVYDISDAGVEVADLMQIQTVQENEMTYTANDDMLYSGNDDVQDYGNDTDSLMMV